MVKSSPVLVGLSLLAVTAAWASPTPPNIEKALAAQYQLVIERPQDSMVHNDLGNLLSLMERFGEAESAYQKAKELDPVDPSIRFNLGLLLQQTGRLDAAAEEYFALLEIDPEHAWAYYQLGTVAYDQGKTKTARERYARSFAIDPTLSFAKHNPHVIDNPLATEALLLSGRLQTRSTSRVPRQYADAGRIADIMLERPEEEADQEGDEESFEEMGEREDGDRPRELSSIERRTSGESFRGGEKDSQDSRVLTNKDLDSVERVGQASGGRASRSSRYSTSSRSRSSSGGSVGTTGSYGADRTQEPPSRYRPGDARRKDVERDGGTKSFQGGVAVGQPVQRAQPAPGRPDVRSRPSAPQTRDESTPSVQRRRYRPGSNSTATVRLKMVGDG